MKYRLKLQAKTFFFNIKKHWINNLFFIIQLSLIIFLFSFILTDIYAYNGRKLYLNNEYKNIYSINPTNIEYDEKSEIKGFNGYIDSGNIKCIYFANNYVFSKFRLPIVKGNYPKADYEAMVNENFAKKYNYKIGETYKIKANDKFDEIDLQFKIVGYCEDNYSYSSEGLMGEMNGINILINHNQRYLKFTNYYLEGSYNEIKKICKSFGYHNEIISINEIYQKEVKRYVQDRRIPYTIFIFIAILILFTVIGTNYIINGKSNKSEKSILYLSGVAKKNLKINEIINTIINYGFCLLITMNFIKIPFPTRITFKSVWVSWIIILALELLILLINGISIKKLNVSENLQQNNCNSI